MENLIFDYEQGSEEMEETKENTHQNITLDIVKEQVEMLNEKKFYERVSR